MTFLSRLSLANRSLVALATIAILIFGALVIPSLKQELYPSLEFPAVTVTATYAGASPAIVEKDVTIPLERSIQGMPDIETITSYSNSNFAIVIVEYDFGVDLNQVSEQLTQQINRVKLPDNVSTQVATFNINSLPVIQLAVTSSIDQAQLASELETKVVPVLSGIDGVAQVSVTGVRDQIVSIVLDIKKMRSAGVTESTVKGLLQANNISLPAGSVTDSGQTLTITAGSTFNSLEELQDLVVGVKTVSPCTQAQIAALGAAAQTKCQPVAVPVKLSDVATVQQTLSPSTSLTRTNGQESLGIAITKTNDGNTVSISQAVTDKIDELQTQLSDGTKISVISNQAPTITSAVSGLVNEGLIGAGFAILVILIFLLSLRSTLVTAISIPLSIVIALIALWVGKLSLNLFTLGAMTIAVGRVVDDSIVVLENIYRHLNLGEEKRVAIPAAVREVAGAVTSSTLTTVAVFLPIAFTGGFVGQVFGPFSVTVTVALLASLFVALTIIPVLAYWFLKAPRARAGQSKEQDHHERTTFLERGYIPMVRWVTGHKAISLIVAFALFFGSLALIPRLGTNFFSSSTQNTYSITQTLPVGTSLDETNKAAQEIENVLNALTPSPIQHYQVTVGGSGGLSALQGNTGGSNSARFSIATEPDIDQAAFQQDLEKRLDSLTDVGKVQLTASSGGFNSSGIAVNVSAPDETTLKEATQQVMDAVGQVANVTDISSNLADASPLINVQVDPTKALLHGLTSVQVAQLLGEVYTGTTVTTVNFNGSSEDVKLQLGTPATTVDEMKNLLLPAQAGQQVTYVKLGDVATVTRTAGPTQITHVDGDRTATVSGTATTNDVGSVNTSILKQINALNLPAGVSVEMSGVAQSQSEAFNSLGLALLAAILLVYLVMVATFRSLIQPLLLLVSIPFAATGSLLLMLATHTQLGVPSLIGLLMLVGIVVTNAIVLLDLVRQYRAQGLDARSAVIEGGRRRLRPILMTAVATILALLPMALGLSKDSGFIAAPLAVTVIGGLATSTVLTLLLVPALYVMVEGRSDRKNKSVPPPVEKEISLEEQETAKQAAVQSS